MSKDNIVDKKSLISSRNPYYNNVQKILKKEIIYDIENGKYYLYDKENSKSIQVNLFGKKIPKINNAQIGKASYNERLKSSSVEKIENKIDDSIYHPRMKNFDGFTQIPRPLVAPFSNNIILQSKNDILNYIKNKKLLYTFKKFETLLEKNNEDIPDLDYYSGTISNILNNKNKNIIIKNIDEAINNGNLNKKEVKSLKIFRKNLLLNSTNVINGKELNKPKDIFQKRYNINHNVIFINPIKDFKKNKDCLINLNTYRNMYNSINNNPLTSLKANNNIINLNSFSKKEKNKNKDILSRPRSVINIKSINNKIYKIKINKNINNILHLPDKYEISKKETKRYDTEEDYKDIFNNKLIMKSHSYNDIVYNEKIHSLKNLKYFYNKEKNYLIGYQKPFNKEIPLLRKGVPKYKSTGELYRKELDMFKLVNPEKIKLEEDENNRRLNYLKKKIEKDRVVQIVKYKHLMGKKSRINSAISNVGNNYIDL